MDRLARSLVDLRRTVDELTDRGVSVRFVKENLTFTADHSDPCGMLMLSVMGKPALTSEQAAEVVRRLAEKKSATALAAEFGVFRATIYNARPPAA